MNKGAHYNATMVVLVSASEVVFAGVQRRRYMILETSVGVRNSAHRQ